MAASTGIFVTTPTAGINLYDAASVAKFPVLTAVMGSDGRKRVYGKCIKAQTSIATVAIGAAGSITTLGSTTATYIMNTTGGFTAGQYGWAAQRII